MSQSIATLEKQRLALQDALDVQKTRAERNRLGQFSTPTALAVDILRYAAELLPKDAPVQFLDPAIGTGAFYAALLSVLPALRIRAAVGFEIDPHYRQPASELWEESGLVIKLADFTRELPSSQFNLVICNPPYVRHHHLSNVDKARLRERTYHASGMRLSGLAGLYCHFLGLAHAWMADNAIGGWLIPSEFMDVNYGKEVKQYLLTKVTLLHIHRFDPNDVQFADALVSSAIVWFRNAPPPHHHVVKFSYGGSLTRPGLVDEIPSRDLAPDAKWTRFPGAGVSAQTAVATLADFFHIKRGLATGNNGYFILDRAVIEARGLPIEMFRPILPSPRYLETNEVRADEHGWPVLNRQLFLLDTALPEEEIRNYSHSLYEYLQSGINQKVHEGFLCRHRKPWYLQETRLPAPIICTYLGRGDTRSGRPFRFILNHSVATVTNVYLAMYPSPVLARMMAKDKSLLRRIWEVLNQLPPERLLGEGRVYGGGLHKLEPRELANVDASAIAHMLPDYEALPPYRQLSLLGS